MQVRGKIEGQRSVPSGAVCVGSNPAGGTGNQGPELQKRSSGPFLCMPNAHGPTLPPPLFGQQP